MSYLKYLYIDKNSTKVFFTHKNIYTKPENLEINTEQFKIIYIEEVMSYDPDKKYCQQIEDAVLNESIFTLDQNVIKCIGYVDAESTESTSYLILESICSNLEEELTNRLQDRYFQCAKCNRLIRDFADNFFVINAEEVCTRCTGELVEKLHPEINNKQYLQHHGILNVTFPFIPDEDVIFNKSRSWDKVGTYNKTDEDILKATKIAEELVKDYGIYVQTTDQEDTFTLWKKAKKLYKYELEDLLNF